MARLYRVYQLRKLSQLTEFNITLDLDVSSTTIAEVSEQQAPQEEISTNQGHD